MKRQTPCRCLTSLSTASYTQVYLEGATYSTCGPTETRAVTYPEPKPNLLVGVNLPESTMNWLQLHNIVWLNSH